MYHLFDVLSVGASRASPQSRETTQVKGRATTGIFDERSDVGSIDIGATIPRCCRPRDIEIPSAGRGVSPRGMTNFFYKISMMSVNKVRTRQ